MGKRHFGSVRRLPSGRYQASYWHDGERLTASQTFRTKGDALAYLSSVETDLRRGTWVNPDNASLRVVALAERWLSSNPAKRLDTLATDRYHLEAHLLPRIGERRIGEVTPHLLQQVVIELSERLAPKTVGRAYGVARAMFAFACETDLLARSPCRGVRLPHVEPRRCQVLTPDEVARLAEATAEEFRAMVWLGAILGLRFSEVAGLRVGRLDLLNRALSVEETVTRDGKGGAVFGPPKSSASRRTLAIPAMLAEILAEHLRSRGLTGADLDTLLFPAPEGGPLRYANWRNRVWVPACRSAGLVGVGFHDLRRLSATLLVRHGVDVKTAQTRLGHADVRLTLGLYAQAVAEADREAAERIGGLFSPAPESTALRSGPYR